MITKLRLNSDVTLEKWLHQNKAEFIGDFVEGVLLDNFVVATTRGIAAVYETYLNSNSSYYRIEFEPYPGQAVMRNWYKFEKSVEETED